MHFGHQRAGRIEERKTPVAGLLDHSRSHPVGAHDPGGSGGDARDIFREDRPGSREIRDHPAVVHHFVVHVHRGAEQAQSLLHHRDRPVYPGAKPPGDFTDLAFLLHEQRLIKSAQELRIMRKAGAISAEAHCRAMRECREGRYEYHLEGAILHEFMENGARAAAYNSIVGAGANACVLHYTENRDRLRDGDLVLIDAGCEFSGYAADITRTFPVSGTFSPEQRAIYDLVLKAQLAAIGKVKPGNTWNQPHDATVRVITRGLIELGLLKGKEKDLIKSGAYRDFYMHRAGHWLGMDVHDVGDYRVDGKWRLLEPGMVLTIEPGIYVATNNTKVGKKWRGIGIRIEDDVAVTPGGCEVLTAGVPKTATDIELLMAAS